MAIPARLKEIRFAGWARLLVTMALLAIATWSISEGEGETMAGAIIGYVAAYWLPPRPQTIKMP